MDLDENIPVHQEHINQRIAFNNKSANSENLTGVNIPFHWQLGKITVKTPMLAGRNVQYTKIVLVLQ